MFISKSMYIYIPMSISMPLSIRHRALVAREECLMPRVVPGRSVLNDFKGPTPPPGVALRCMTLHNIFGSIFQMLFQLRSLFDV